MKSVKYNIQILHLTWLLFTFSLYAGDERQEILRNALDNKQISPCKIVLEMGRKYGSLFDSAVKQCDVPAVLEYLPLQRDCGSECLHILHKHHPDIDVNKPDDGGYTPLHYAVAQDEFLDIAKIKYLIAHGADVLRENNYGTTPCDIAVQSIERDVAHRIYRNCGSGLLSKSIWMMLPSTRGLLLLQQNTTTNILDSQRYPFYKNLIKMSMNPFVSFCDEVPNDGGGDNAECCSDRFQMYEMCKRYYTYFHTREQIKKAARRHYIKSTLLRTFNYFFGNNSTSSPSKSREVNG